MNRSTNSTAAWVPRVGFRKLDPDAQLPSYATPCAAGLDLASVRNMIIYPGEPVVVPTGLAMELPAGYEAQIRPRSGLAMSGITVLNSPGTIDSDYRGEIKVILINHGLAPQPIRVGQRIAQMVIAPVAVAQVELVEEMSETVRGAGGLGSTGL